MTADHLPEVMKIEQASFHDPWTLTAFRDLMIQSRTNWVALVEDKVAGYLMTQWVLDELHILNIAVAKEFRRKGVAAALLNFLLDLGRARKSRVIFLEVRVSNSPAISFYQKYGFSILSTRKRYYRDGEDAWVMHKSL